MVAIAIGFGFLLAQVLYMAQAVALKWLVLGRSIPGRYKADSAYALRFKCVQFLFTAPLARSFCAQFAESSLVPVLLRALGAKLDGMNIIYRISPLMLAGADQLYLADSAILAHDAVLLGAVVIGDTLLIAKTKAQLK